MLPLEPITTAESPRKILKAIFNEIIGELPIRGGWGYTQADACIIDMNDPIVDSRIPFNGIGIEYIFAEYRNYIDMIALRPEGEKYAGIRQELEVQYLIDGNDGRLFDKLVFNVTAMRQQDFNEMKAEFEGPNGYGSLGFDEVAHEKRRQYLTMHFKQDYWFDITSFFGATTKVAFAPASEVGKEVNSGRLSNSKLIDAEQGLFSVLGLVTLCLTGPIGVTRYWWHGEDLVDEMAKGSYFGAIKEDLVQEGIITCASITVVDVTNDASEPDVSTLEQANIQAIDDRLNADTQSALQAQGRGIVHWMSSQMSQSDCLKRLFTTYITRELNAEWQSTFLRFNVKGRKIVAIGSFDIARRESFAEPIFNALRSIAVLE